MAFIVMDRSRRLLQDWPQKSWLFWFCSNRWICVGVGIDGRLGLLGGMSLAMCVEQLFQTDLSVNLSCVQFRVAKDGLNGADVCACVVHERGHGVTKDVASSGLFDVGTLDLSASVLGQRVGIDGRA